MRRLFPCLVLINTFLLLHSCLVWGQTVRERLTARIDSLVASRLDIDGLPGAVVTVVRDSGIWMLKGYGMAHVAAARPVDKNTPFRVGGIGQVLTATAMLQLVDEQRLDLQTDIDYYLDGLELERRFREKITPHQLLTHTAGFDECIPSAVRDGEALIPLSQLVAVHQPPQVHPPGQVFHYAPFNYALAGYLIEQIRGKPFEQGMKEAVLQPLGMTYSTFAQPPSTAIDAQLATGYAGRKMQDAGPDFTLFAPADGLITTGSDMAAFMLSQLGTGDSLLTPAGRILQLSQQYTANPSPEGVTYGYLERFDHGQRVLSMEGKAPGYSSSILLLPGLQLGVFVAANGESRRLHREVQELVLDLFFGARSPFDLDLQPNRLYMPVNGSRYAGRYRRADYPHSSFLRAPYLLGWAGAEREVQPADAGALLIDGQRMVITAPNLFTDPQQGVVSLGFRLPRLGKATHLTAGRIVYERIRWWERPALLKMVLILSAFLAIGSGLAWPVYHWMKERTAEKLPPQLWRALLSGASLAWLAGLSAIGLYLSLAINYPGLVRYGPNAEMIFVLTLVLIAVIAAAVFPVVTFFAWQRRWWSMPTRLLLTAQSLVLIAAVFVLNHLHLVGYRL